MLTVYIRGDRNTNLHLSVEEDVEKLFTKVRLKGTEAEKRILKVIEQASYNDANSFIDRFGFKLYTSELSTGCKAALCVIHFPAMLIDIKECGLNARDTILSLCDQGNILMDYSETGIADYSNGSVEVQIDGYLFHTISRLNTYLQDERPFEPYLDGEVTKCSL